MRLGRAAGVTDTGRRRLRNEDAFVCEPPLFAVTDGMGGARAGQIAAELAATALEEGAAQVRGTEALVALVEEANRRIWQRSVEDPQTTGMGAVATVALVEDGSGTVAIGHVGDSRAYLLREGGIEQLTRDHSLVAELVESGVLTPEEAERHPQRSAITRALGTEPSVEVDAFTVEARPGDVFLLCSDGLSAMVADDVVASTIETMDRDPARAADALVSAANARGGEDNITVVLFELVEAAEGALEEESGTQGTASSGQPPDEPEEHEPEPAAPPETQTAAVETSRHGAGSGGRIAALGLLAALLVIAVLALYTGISR
ncbi:MAG: Stp1/IreP family PP2C-type Ser/Thr phosphatase [Gaiellaceae bacterium]